MASNSDCPPTPSSNQSKKWASGRTLTEKQRARKREADRAGHKERRQKTQSRILQLEAKLENVGQEPANEKILHLMSQLERLESENRTLLQCLGSSIFSTDTPPYDAALPLEDANISTARTPSISNQTSDVPQVLPCSAVPPPEILEGASPVEFLIPNMDSPALYNLDTQRTHLDLSIEAVSNLQTRLSPKSQLAVARVKKNLLPPSTSSHQTGTDVGTLNIAHRCNVILSSIQWLTQKDICTDDQTNQNILILAVMEGWKTAENRLTFCPLWKILREIDCMIFWPSSPVERVVMLRMIHFMLICMVKDQTFDELPSWYRPRPVQQKFPHEAVMTYFAWPCLRERLVLSQQTILTNEFWHAFARSFRFYWPYDTRAAFEKDKWTGNYRFSGCFENYIREIRMWRMDLEFFSRFPFLVDDIFPQESMPQVVYHNFNQDMPWVLAEPGSPLSPDGEFREETVSENSSVVPFTSFEPMQTLPGSWLTPYLNTLSYLNDTAIT